MVGHLVRVRVRVRVRARARVGAGVRVGLGLGLRLGLEVVGYVKQLRGIGRGVREPILGIRRWVIGLAPRLVRVRVRVRVRGEG